MHMNLAYCLFGASSFKKQNKTKKIKADTNNLWSPDSMYLSGEGILF